MVDLVGLLAGELGARPAGSEAARRAATAIGEVFEELGLDVRTQEFPFLAYQPDEPVLAVDGERWECGPVMYALPAEVEGTVRRIGRHRALPGLFEPVVYAIEGSGRELGRVYVNPLPGGGAVPFPTGYGPTLTGPAVYVSESDGERLQDGMRVAMRAGGGFVPTVERNVIGELAGSVEECVIVCAHYDSAWRAPGAVDNASGIEAVRRVLEQLGDVGRRRTLVGIAFGAEECALAGSRFFVHDAIVRGQLEKVAAVVNIECVGRGERLELWASPDDLRERGLRLAREAGHGELVTRPAIAGSDHYWFAVERVPAACVIRWPYAEYHLTSDRVELVDEQLLAEGAEFARRLVEELLSGS